MIGAVEVAGLRQRVGRIIFPLGLRLGDEVVKQVELGVARDAEVLRRAPDAHGIGVEDGDRLGDREERVRGVIFASQKALFLSRYGEEEDGPVGPRTAREGAALLDQLADAGPVVASAVVNGVAAVVGLADAEM